MPKIFLVLFFLTAAALGAQETFRVDFTEGQWEVQDGPAWKEPQLGQVLAPTATLRLKGPGLLVLQGAGYTITIHQPGVYSLASLQKAWQKSAKPDQSLKNQMSKLLGETPKPSAAAMGIRGSAAQDGPAWQGGSETQALIDSALSALNRGEYELAVSRLEEAAELVPEDGEAEIGVLLAAADFQAGKPARQALARMDKLTLLRQSDRFEGWCLLKARLLADAGRLAEAETWIAGCLKDVTAVETRQGLLFVQARLLLVKGKVKERQAVLAEIAKLDPLSELGILAREQ